MSMKTLVAALAATTLLAGGAALAAGNPSTSNQSSAEQSSAMPSGHQAAVHDFGKLSSDGVRGYQDLTLARLAIFDGRVGDAKKLAADADNAFNKAKSDNSVFTKAEADMRTHMKDEKGQTASGANGNGSSNAKEATNGESGANQSSSSSGAKVASNTGSNTESESSSKGQDVHTPIAWLPVDETVTLNEDYTAQPAKAKAVADANQSLAKGDRKGAMDKLRLAGLDLDVGLAVVPLKQTLSDVGEAEQLIDSGKYYEGSQKLRAVQDSTVLSLMDVPATPGKGGAQTNGQAGQDKGQTGMSGETSPSH